MNDREREDRQAKTAKDREKGKESQRQTERERKTWKDKERHGKIKREQRKR